MLIYYLKLIMFIKIRKKITNAPLTLVYYNRVSNIYYFIIKTKHSLVKAIHSFLLTMKKRLKAKRYNILIECRNLIYNQIYRSFWVVH